MKDVESLLWGAWTIPLCHMLQPLTDLEGFVWGRRKGSVCTNMFPFKTDWPCEYSTEERIKDFVGSELPK